MRAAMAVMVCLIGAIGINAGPDEATEPDFRALYGQYTQAIQDRGEAFAGFLTDDFSITTTDGVTHGLPDWVASGAEGPSICTITVESISPRADGDVAVVALQQVEREVKRSALRVQRMTMRVVQREIWRYTGQGWKIRKIEQLLGPMLFEGEEPEGWL